MPNRLTLLYSKIYYKKENYLKVKTVVFKYITPLIVKVGYVSILIYSVRSYIPIFLRSHVPNFLSCVTYATRPTPRPMALLVPSVPPLAH